VIISFGQSLGTAVATHLAAHRQVAAVVLEAPFPSASRVAHKVFWFLRASAFLRGTVRYTNLAKEIRAPILIVHCNQDPVIPFQFGQEVYAAALPPKKLPSNKRLLPRRVLPHRPNSISHCSTAVPDQSLGLPSDAWKSSTGNNFPSTPLYIHVEKDFQSHHMQIYSFYTHGWAGEGKKMCEECLEKC